MAAIPGGGESGGMRSAVVTHLFTCKEKKQPATDPSPACRLLLPRDVNWLVFNLTGDLLLAAHG